MRSNLYQEVQHFFYPYTYIQQGVLHSHIQRFLYAYQSQDKWQLNNKRCHLFQYVSV
nr:hypothetical protein GGBNIMDK_00010 [Bacillus cereus]WLE91171.1 hypothetical protein GGBNIMDK_00202 [Bacillus cereus]